MGGQGEREVHRPGRQQLVRLRGLGLLDADPDPGVRAAQGGDGGDHQRGHGGGERAEPDLARLPRQVSGEFRVGALQLGEDRLGVPQDQVGGVGEADPAALRLQQRDAELPGEVGERLRDGRGRHVQRLGRRGDGAVFGQGPQDPQLLDVPLGRAGHGVNLPAGSQRDSAEDQRHAQQLGGAGPFAEQG